MATGQSNGVFRHLGRVALLPDGAGLTDGQLLERFVTRREEAAFEALVRRHGPMVLGVCRRVLHHGYDADDAFQATFVVLVRKAVSVKPRELVGNWLYGVAYRTALEARSLRARRQAKEMQVTEIPEPAAPEADAWPDLRPLLDQELSRLPDKYRQAVVLCDLEGRSRRDVARQLRIPEGTLSSRLAAARRLLAQRLTRRGLGLSGGALAITLSQNAARAGVPASLVVSTTQAAAEVAAKGAAAAVSANVAALSEGVLKSMFLNKLKIATVALLIVAGVMVLGFVQPDGPVVAAQPQQPGNNKAPAPKKDDGKDAAKWQVQATFEGHGERINRLTFAPGGKALASASDDSTVKVWDLATKKELVSLKDPDGGGMRGLAFAPDRKTIATAGGDKIIRLWDVERGTQIQEFAGHTAPVFCVVFSADGKSLVSGGGSSNYPDKGQNGYGEIRIWDPATGKERARVQSHTWPVARLVFTPDGKTLISGGYDNTIKLWDLDDKGQLQERLTMTVGSSQGIYDMDLSPDGKTLAVAGDGTVKLWDVTTGKERDTVLEKSAYRDGFIWLSVVFSPDGKTVAAASPMQEWENKDKKFVVQRRSDILLWDVATGKIRDKQRVDEPVMALAFSPDGKILATGCKGKMRMPARLQREEDLETEKRGAVILWELKQDPADKDK